MNDFIKIIIDVFWALLLTFDVAPSILSNVFLIGFTYLDCAIKAEVLLPPVQDVYDTVKEKWTSRSVCLQVIAQCLAMLLITIARCAQVLFDNGVCPKVSTTGMGSHRWVCPLCVFCL